MLLSGPVTLGRVGFDVSTMIYMAAVAVVGYQAVLFSILTKLYAAHEGFLPVGPRFKRLADLFSLERGVVLGALIFVVGTAIAVWQFSRWGRSGFGELDPRTATRIAIPAMVGMMIGFQTVMASMFAGTLSIATRSAPSSADLALGVEEAL